MSNYKRFTRACTLEQLQPALRQALRDYFAKHNLTEIDTDIMMCCETTSERQAQSALAALLGEDRDQVYYTVALVTPNELVWAHSGDKSGVSVISAKLKEIRVKPYTSLLVKDNGLEVNGFVGDAHAFVRGYIGLGAEPAAQKFLEVVKQAVEQVNPTRSLLDMFLSRHR